VYELGWLNEGKNVYLSEVLKGKSDIMWVISKSPGGGIRDTIFVTLSLKVWTSKEMFYN